MTFIMSRGLLTNKVGRSPFYSVYHQLGNIVVDDDENVLHTRGNLELSRSWQQNYSMYKWLNSFTCVVDLFVVVLLTIVAPAGTGKEWTPESLVNPDELGNLYQGDIMLPLPLTKNGILDESYRWPGGVVAYEFNNEYSEFYSLKQ